MPTSSSRKDRKIAPRPRTSSGSSHTTSSGQGTYSRSQSSSPKNGSTGSQDDSSSRSYRSSSVGSSAMNSSTSSAQVDVEKLPRSVRYQSPEARLAIRRRQNNESAKRGRDRRREEKEEMSSFLTENNERIKKLESQVDDLEETLRAKSNARKQGKGKSGGASRKPRPGEFFEEEKFFGDPF